jgi:arsenite-transporting ATPase
MLTDPARTSFFFVTLPETLPIAVITRFIGWFHEFRIPVGCMIVNMLIDQKQVNTQSPGFVKNREAMQDWYLLEIWEKIRRNGARSTAAL